MYRRSEHWVPSVADSIQPIAPAFDRMMTESECTYCGQCVAVCPVGALTERDYTNRLLDDLANPDKVVIVQTRTCRTGGPR